MEDEVCYIALLVGGIIFVILTYTSYLEKKKKEEKRIAEIDRHRNEWGDQLCDVLIDKRIAIDMTEEMVRLGWGKPTTIEQKEITKKGRTTRWIYGIPRHGAKYVWFKNGIVTKIKQ